MFILCNCRESSFRLVFHALNNKLPRISSLLLFYINYPLLCINKGGRKKMRKSIFRAVNNALNELYDNSLLTVKNESRRKCRSPSDKLANVREWDLHTKEWPCPFFMPLQSHSERSLKEERDDSSGGPRTKSGTSRTSPGLPFPIPPLAPGRSKKAISCPGNFPYIIEFGNV